MLTLEKLLKEKAQRKTERRQRPAASKVETPAAPAAPVNPQDLLEVWKAKRAAGAKRDLSAGELANMIEGLTPDGFDKEGRKVSFVEGEQGLGLECLSDRPRRLSGK